ncbi:RagB/SusD family nutrient uptake outer membrane protein [Gynurincola endophyticus]|uniref:RagB/SusD family nutrient uptake outer membrane protein n=1 Tax=Gynurincola endophyticus TaxID=2479004 RepID=UPI000F8C3C00|nr:RagB/SusD family nutrient uptake outer membrane protein [Gynurincola endophyticus]
MKFKKYIAAITFGCLGALSFQGCTKLDENVYSQFTTDNYYNNRDEVLSAVLRPYTHANAWITPGQNGWWRVSELSADQLAWPVKGRHGQDGGQWIRDHYHEWQEDGNEIWGPWRLMWWGLGLCSDPIENLEKRTIQQMGITEAEKNAYIAEMRLLRAFHYLRLMDIYGNIPIIAFVGEPSPATRPRADVFNFIESEILASVDAAAPLSSAMMGRATKAAGYAMLVELYLNAEKWTGTPRWNDVVTYSDKLINGEGGAQNGTMELDANITDTYVPDNHLSKEVIFSIVYDFKAANSWKPQWNGDFYHFAQRFIYDGIHNGNNGVVVIPGVFDTFDDEDKRKREWILEGPQYYYGTTNPVMGTEEYSGRPLVFVDKIERTSENKTDSDMTQGEENSGVRFNKYKPGRQNDANYMSSDWAIYRLTWIYFAKAEALMRLNNGASTQAAVDLINATKSRAFDPADWSAHAYTTATLDLDELLAERGREFIFEGFRRQDLIRFGKFLTGSWWDHEPTLAPHKEILPIPTRQIVINPNLKQNPGYN